MKTIRFTQTRKYQPRKQQRNALPKDLRERNENDSKKEEEKVIIRKFCI